MKKIYQIPTTEIYQVKLVASIAQGSGLQFNGNNETGSQTLSTQAGDDDGPVFGRGYTSENLWED